MSNTNGISGSPLLQTLLAQSNAVSAARTAQVSSAGPSASATTQDTAQVSAAASALLRGATEDVRTQKVQSLQTAIASGEYSVSASNVADKLIQTLLR